MRQFAPAATLVAALVAIPSVAAADPIRVTAGAFNPDFEGHIIHFTGAGFALDHARDPTNLGLFIPSVVPNGSCERCDPGQVVTENFTTRGDEYLGIGSATIDGTTYQNVTFRGSMDFQAEPFTMPVGHPEGTFFNALTTFAFTGAIRGYSGDAEVFRVALFGNGRVMSEFFFFDNNFLREESGGPVFLFEDVAATPEPSTLVLVGLGLAAAARAKRAARSRSI